jgi:hypothetical protein
LNRREDWESQFPNIPSDLFSTIRKKLLQNDIQKPNTDIYQLALKEAGVPY